MKVAGPLPSLPIQPLYFPHGEMPEQHRPQMVCQLSFAFSVSAPVSSPATPSIDNLKK